MSAAAAPVSLKDFARRCLRERLEIVVRRIHDAARLHDEPSVHDLRVAIRRLQQALRLFSAYVPDGGARRVRKRLRRIIRAAAEVRNRDIALKILAQQQVDAGWVELERQAAMTALFALLEHSDPARLAVKWRAQLALE